MPLAGGGDDRAASFGGRCLGGVFAGLQVHLGRWRHFCGWARTTSPCRRPGQGSITYFIAALIFVGILILARFAYYARKSAHITSEAEREPSWMVFQSASLFLAVILGMVVKGKITWPGKVVGPVKDLIAGLLVKEPAEQLPMLKGGIQNLKARPSCVGTERVESNPNDKPRDKIDRSQLTRIGLLGCGGCSTIELWEHKKTKETYALKALSKGYIVKTGMQKSVINEKNMFMMTNSPFIIRLWETYNGEKTIYFLLEPALGGDLYATYNRKGFHGSEEHARFYVAGVIEGFQHMHERRIIYRDLIPENLLLNDLGQLKITDMGLAKFVIGKTYTTCGTPDYFAPELIASRGHTNALDWWTLGILVFELMSGHPPFESSYPMQIYAKVIKGKITWPRKVVGPVKDLIAGLLVKEPSERLPMLKGGIQNLKDHAWYSGFNWEAFREQGLDPPYKPTVKSKKDLANFCAKEEDMPRQLDYHDDGSGWDKDFAS